MKKTIMLFLVLTLGAGAAVLYAGSGDLIVDGNTTVTNLGFWGTAPDSRFGLYASSSVSDPSSSYAGVFTRLYPTYTTGATQYTTSGYFLTLATVNPNVTQAGYDRGILAQAFRNCNGASAQDNGTLAMLYGEEIDYGHFNTNGSASPLTTNAYGLSIFPYYMRGTITNMYDIYLASPSSGGTVTNRWGIYQANTANNSFGGNVGIGTANLGTGGSAALVLGNGSKPTSLSNAAGLHAGVVAGTTELFGFDDGGNQTQLTPHAGDAPDWVYDAADGLPLLVREVQYFLGYVRYTNQTRQARLTGMTDAQKSALSAQQTTCVFTESFADHNARLGLTGGAALVKLDWETEQQSIKAIRDAEVLAAKQSLENLQAAIAATQDPDIRAELIQQESTIIVPDQYIIKDPPPRLKAALDSGNW
jgi:hypothetical protein